MKVGHASFSVGKDSESSSHYRGGPEKLMHTSFDMN